MVCYSQSSVYEYNIKSIKGELTWKIYLCILLFICSYNAQKTCFNK